MPVHPNLLAWVQAAGEDAFQDGTPRSANLADALPSARLTESDRGEVRAAWASGWDGECLRTTVAKSPGN